MKKVGIGIIGCGNISSAYLKAMASFPILDIRGLADMNEEVAKARAAEFGLQATSVDALLSDPSVEIIVNLTIPKAHVEVGLRALDAGKHAYSEKPLGINFTEGKRLADAAKAKGLRIGSAPDTFLGGGHQTARRLIDEGVLGQPVGGTATFMCPGHERWHPNPAFYYEVGGGPMLDMGPYYITDLVNLFGPVAKVAGFAIAPRNERLITSEPKNGEKIPVHVATHVSGVLAFENGAVVQVGMSFDVAGHKHVPLEIYGTEGTLIVPDPNHFGGEVQLLKKGGQFEPQALSSPYADGNYRSIGVADMAHAIRENRPHRANGDLALHVLEVMEASLVCSGMRTEVEVSVMAHENPFVTEGERYADDEENDADRAAKPHLHAHDAVGVKEGDHGLRGVGGATAGERHDHVEQLQRADDRKEHGKAHRGAKHRQRDVTEFLPARRAVDFCRFQHVLVDGLKPSDKQHHVETEIFPDDDAEHGIDRHILVGQHVGIGEAEEIGDGGEKTVIAIINETPDQTRRNVSQNIGQKEHQPEGDDAGNTVRQHHGEPDRQRNLDQDRDKDDQAIIHQGLREGGIAEQDLEILQAHEIGRRAVSVPAIKAVPRRLAHGQDDEQGKEQKCRRQKHQQGQRPVMCDRALLALCRAPRRYGRRSHGNIRHLYPLSWRQIGGATYSAAPPWKSSDQRSSNAS